MSPSEPSVASISDQPVEDGTLLTASCPLPITNYQEIVLAHGSGGKLSHQLISKIIVPQFANELLAPMHAQQPIRVTKKKRAPFVSREAPRETDR